MTQQGGEARHSVSILGGEQETPVKVASNQRDYLVQAVSKYADPCGELIKVMWSR